MQCDPARMRHAIAKAIQIAFQSGQVDGDHHKGWVIDQMVRALTGCQLVEKNAIDCRQEPYTYKGFSESDLYKKFIDDVAPTTAALMYYFMGEPFLHKRSYEMIRYAREKDIYVDSCTNGDFVDAAGIIYSDINEINFQIGGMTQKTHEIYRVKSNIEKIHRNLYALIDERRKNPKSSVQINA